MWTSGYLTEIAYTFGYYSELNPVLVDLAFANAGLIAPGHGKACELGFGQGVSINLHAAASDTQWYGTDFNPAQAAFAQDLAAASGAAAHLYDQTFAEFCDRSDLPEFDYIGLHGIWSWISDENRGVIVDFLRRKLKIGGVLYISYNAQPGWASLGPMRNLLNQHSEVMSAPGRGMHNRVEDALDFMDKLIATDPKFVRNNPRFTAYFKDIKSQDRSYLAHEYFNKDWMPMSIAEMEQWLAPAKLTFATSAHYLDHVAPINLTAEQQTFLSAIPDAIFRETVRDFMIDQRFRKDYWVRGVRKLPARERLEALRRQSVVLARPRADVALKTNGVLGEVKLHEAVYGPLLDALADQTPKTLGQLEEELAGQGVTITQLAEAAIILVGAGSLQAAQGQSQIEAARPRTDRLNAFLWDRARSNGEIQYLASPVTGGGFGLGRVEQLFLLAISKGKAETGDWAGFVWEVLSAQGERLVKDGKPIETPEANLAELALRAQVFADKHLPLLKSLGIA